MKVTKAGSITGTVTVPGDKSISHRAVMFSSLAEGKTTISNFLPGADCLSTIACFRKLGVDIEVDGTSVTVYGNGWYGLKEPVHVLDVGNSGTTIRLMMGILASQPFHCVLVGDDSIAKRPMQRVSKPLRQMGAKIDGRNGGEYTPISIRGGELNAIAYESPVASAQVKSAILLAGVKANGATSVTEPTTSRDHTERMLKSFGIHVESADRRVTIKGGQSLYTPGHITVPGDISSAAFLLTASAMVANSELLIKNVGINPTRTGILDVFQKMGVDLQVIEQRNFGDEPVADLFVRFSKNLRGCVIEGELIPRLIDEIPIIAVLATQAEGKTIIKDAAELKVKETNRIETVVSELKKLGAQIESTDDGMIIEGPTKLTGALCNSHGDHRIGMAMAIAGLVAEGMTQIENAQSITVSFPGFSDLLKKCVN